tara:strand:+ start:926 stop:1141 length:216 start_codon:yes stop_codon:yes gene_type:complete
MGEAKRRKELGLPPREKAKKLELPKLDKENIQNNVRSTLYMYPIIPILFYAVALAALVWGIYNLVKVNKLI